MGCGVALSLPKTTSRLGYFVTTRSLSDLIDAFAIIELIKTSSVTTQVDDIIRPVEVYTKIIHDESGKMSHGEPSIIFRSESGAFPMDIKSPFEYTNKQMLTLSNVAMHGTKLNMFVVCGEPTNRIGEVFLNWPSWGGIHKYALHKANSVDQIRKVNQFVAFKIADIIGDELSREQERSFWDAVNSRCSFFTRTRYAVVIDDKLPQPTFAEDVASFLKNSATGPPLPDTVSRINRGLRTRYNIPMDRNIILRKDKYCNSKQIMVKVLGKTLRSGEKCIYSWRENANLPASEFVKWSLNVEATDNAFRLCTTRPMPEKEKGALPKKFVRPDFPSRQALYEAFATRSRYSDSDNHYNILGHNVYMGENTQPQTQPLVFCHSWEDDTGTLSEFINKYI